MKWVKFDADFKESTGYLYNQLFENNNKYLKKICFELIPNITRIEFEKSNLYKEESSKEIGRGQYRKWFCHKVPDQYLDHKYFDPQYFNKKNENLRKTSPIKADQVIPHTYEIFVGGWLHFFDTQVQNGYSNYALYFDWDFDCKSVTGYILQLVDQEKQLNINVNVNITNPPGSQDPPHLRYIHHGDH